MAKRKFQDDEERRKYLEQMLSSMDDDEEDEEESEDEEDETELPFEDESEDETELPDEEESEDEEDESEDEEDETELPDEEESEDEELPDEEDWEEDGEEEADEDVDDDYEAEEPDYDKGTRVLVDCDNGKAWLGTVTKVNKDGTLSIHFDNGDDEVHECSSILGVGRDEIHKRGIPMKIYKKYLKGAKKKDDSATVIQWKEGMRVLACLGEFDGIYLGTISKVLGDKLKVNFDDGDVLTVNMDNIKGIGRQKPYTREISINNIDKYRGEIPGAPEETNDDYTVNPAVEKAVERVRELLERAVEQQAVIKKEGPYQPGHFDGLSRKDKAAVLCLYGILSGTDDERRIAYKKALKAGVKPKLPTF